MKNVIILRGLPGSGKSTYAEDLRRQEPATATVSADKFFTRLDGSYHFDPTRLSLAHRDCWLHFYGWVSKGLNQVIVDNTNITAAEIAPYVLPAEANGYRIQIITLSVDPKKAFTRGIHNVPWSTIEKMAKRLEEEKLPPWWEHIVETEDGWGSFK